MTSDQTVAKEEAARRSMSDTVVAVYGAAGHTGRFVAAELARRGMSPLLCGRDEGKLNVVAANTPGSEVRVASIDDPLSLDQAFDGAQAVINCAGPYLDTASPVIEAAIRARIHYLDLTAEQASVAATFENYATQSETAGIVVAPAMAFYGGLADLLSTLAVGDWSSADDVRIATALDSWRPTLGTRVTGERNTIPRVVWSENRLQLLEDPAPTGTWNFPEPFGAQDVVEVPLSEIITLSRHLPTPEIHSYLNLTPLADLNDPNTPPPVATDEAGRSSQTFLVDVMARRGSEARRANARGRDIYAVSAPIVVEATVRILDGTNKRIGAAAASELFDAAEFLASLEPDHLVIETS
jgi:saccharopine dehydrogenase-like protein